MKEKKIAPIVGNEVIGHVDTLWKTGQWKRDYPILWRWRKSAEDWREKRRPNGFQKYLLRSAILSAVLLIAGVVSWFSLHAEVAKFYPNSCLGGWQHPENAQGEPNLSLGADALEFNDANSAVLSDAASQIFCGSFVGEIPQNAEMKNLVLKLSWSLGGSTPKLENLGVEPPSDASSTVTIVAGEDIASSTQEAKVFLLDAPPDAAFEIHLEDTPPLVAPPPTETPVMTTDHESRIMDLPAEQQAGHETNDTQPVTSDQLPAISDPAPVSFFRQLFRFAFAEEASGTEQLNNGTTTTVAPFVIPSEEGIQKTVTTLDPRMREDDGRRDGTTTTENHESGIMDLPAEQQAGQESTTTEESSPPADGKSQESTTTDETATLGSSTPKLGVELPSDTPASPEFLEVLYTLDGATWHSLGKVSKSDMTDEFKIPVSAWADISKLQVSIQSMPSIDTLPKVYLDGMWLEAEYENLMPEKAPEKGSGIISSVGSVEGPISFLATEIVDGAESYILTLDNPGLAPDYTYQFTNKGVRLLSRREGKQKELMSGVEPIPEYQAKDQNGVSVSGTTDEVSGGSISIRDDSGTTTTANTGGKQPVWQAYALSALPGTYSGWREDTSNGGRRMIREFETNENGTTEIFTEIWEIPESAEDLGNKGPKATYKMTKNNATSSLPWRLRLAYNGIRDIKKENDDIKDADNYPIRNRVYGDFSINLRDFDEMEAKGGKPRHIFSEKSGGAEAIFFPDGTDGERIVDPTMITAGVATGWGHNKTRAVFYTGARFWLLYTDATGKIYYKSSADNSTWTATSTLVVNMSTTNVDFDTFLVDNTKFDLGYPNSSEDPIAVTVTVSGSTLATSTASAVGAATTCNSISLARTPSADRIFLACRNGAGLEVYSANQTGDANSISTWTTEIGGATETEMVNQVTMAPYGGTDKVLVLYEKDGATDTNDCIWSRAITRSTGAGTAVKINCDAGVQFASDTFGNVARTASSTFSFVYHDTSGTAGLREAVWNDSSWATSTVVASGAGIKSPSLFYDNVTSDLYAFASSTAGVVYYKKTAGAWGSAITADNSEGASRQNSFPVTQMQMAFPAEQTFLPWAYRTTNGANFDLKVGTLGLHGTTTQRAYFFLNDDGNGTATTTDTYTKSHGVTATSSSISNVKIGERLIARIQVDNITAGTSTKMYRLQWENNTDAANVWNDLSTTTAIRWALSEKGALKGRPGEVPLATAQLGAAGACVTAGTTYQQGRFVAGNATSSVISLGPSKCTELAFAIETSGALANKTYRLRLVNGASGLPFDQSPQNGAYTVFPTFSIEPARTLTFSKEARGAQATSTLDTVSDVGQHTSIAIGTDGFPVISYYDNTGGIKNLNFAKCSNASCSSFATSTIDAGGDVGQYTSLAIGTDGFPVIAYYDLSNANLNFAKCNNISCSSVATSTLDAGVIVGQYTSVSIGTDGFPVISYYDAFNGNLNFAKCNNISCSSVATSILDAGGSVGLHTSIAIGADGFPVISYQDNSNLNLNFAKCNNMSCSLVATSTIDAGGNVGQYTSLAIGTDGFPMISYYDVSNGNLNFAKCNNASCSSFVTFILDAVGTVGLYTSIAIGTDGFPVISYYDASNANLNFAKCTSIDCATASSATANLPSDARNFDTFLDDTGYNNVATSDNLYDSLSAATSNRLAFNFKKATSSNTDQIAVTWEGQVSVSTTTSLQIFNNTSGLWETLQSSTTPTAGVDFTLTGTANSASYYDASNLVAVRAVTGTTTAATTLKTDQIIITFSPGVPTLTQRAYIFLNDDGGNVDSYTKSHSAATSSSISNVKIGERLIARIQVDNTGTATSTNQYRLQWRAAAGAFADLSTTTAIRYSLSEKGALWGRPDGVPLATRQVDTCNASAPTYTEGRFTAGTATTTAFSIGPAQCTELAFAIETSGAAVNTTYELRVVSASTTTLFSSYAVTPTFSIEPTRTLTFSKEARGGFSLISTDVTGDVGAYTSTAIGADGFPAVSYRGGGDLKFMKCNNISCSSFAISTIDSVNDTGFYTSIAIGTDGFPVISYFDTTLADLKFAKCNNISCSSFATSTIDSAGSVGSRTSLAIGADGFPVISYRDFTTGGTLRFAKCNNISCSSVATSTIDAGGDVGSHTSIAIGADGFPVISYYDVTNTNLNFAKCNNLSCSSVATSTLDTAGNVGLYTSIAIGADGFPVISYEDFTNGGLKFVKCQNINCSSFTVSTLESLGAGNTDGEFTSLAIGTDGFPVISFHQDILSLTNSLQFAKCNNASCSSVVISTLDSVGFGSVIGQYTSLAIGTNGFPVVSYYDNTNGNLKFVRCTSIDCADGSTASSNLPSDARNFDTFLDDAGYNNVATSDNLYDSLSAATSSRLAFNFKKATSSNTDQIAVTWEGQVSVSTTISLQIFNNTSGLWETLQSSTTPTASTDFTLTGTVQGVAYFDGSNIVATRAVTGITTAATTLKTDQIIITFSPGVPTLTQRAYIFLNDDGGNVDSYTKSHSAATSSSISNVKIGERLIARIQVDNTGTATSTNQYRLQWRAAAGAFADLSTTTAIRYSLSQKGALWGRSGEVPLATRQVDTCNASAPTYTAGRFVAGTATTTAFSIGPAQCTELAFAIETSGAVASTTYELRVVSASTTTLFSSYAVTPTFTTEITRTLTYSKEARGAYATSTLDAGGTVGQYTSIAIGTDGFPVISYYDNTNGNLNFAKCNNMSCSSFATSTIDAGGNVGSFTSIAIGADGFPVMSYRNISASRLGFAKCNNISCSSVATSTLDSANNPGQFTSIAIGADGFPVISYYVLSNSNLNLAKCNNISCSSFVTSTLDAGGNVGQYTSIAIGADGFPVISYEDATNTNVNLAKCNNISCSSVATSTIDAPGNLGQYTSIAIGTDGFPVISYFNNTSQDLNFAKCNNISCSSVATSTIDSVDSVGSNSSIAIGTDGFPVMSYFDGTNNDLKFIKCNNISCSSVVISTLDSSDDSGQFTSIAIGTDGFPVMSYYASTTADLRFVKCASIDCATAASSTANLPNTSSSLSTFLDDTGYNNVAASDNLYDSLSAATSNRLAFNFKKATSSNTDQIAVTWEGQVSVSTTTSLQIFNNTSDAWETLQSSTTPTASTDFTLTGTVQGVAYFDGSNIVATRAVTGTTTAATTLKTDQIIITFSPGISLTFTATTAVFGTLTPGTFKIATTTLNVTTGNTSGYFITMHGNNQGSGSASTTLYLSPTIYTTNIADQTEWVPGSATTSAGNAVVRGSLDSAGQVLAFRVMSASGSIPFLSTAWWGTNDADGTAKWAGAASSTVARQIGNSSAAAPTAALNTVQYYLDAPVTQPQGLYTGDITFTATVNP